MRVYTGCILPPHPMDRTCASCSAAFTVTADDAAFHDRVSPVIAGQKLSIPPPTLCPDCRQQRRMALANERFLFPGTCALCNKHMLTEHPPYGEKRNVYCRACWNSDRWDPCTYGRPFDFTRPFFDQFRELWRDVPAQNLLTEGTNENSEYIHYAGFAKNCYLVMHADFCEDCYYGYGFKRSTSCVDGFYNLQCELCYDCVDVHGSYGLRGCQDCVNCSSSSFLRDCVGCKNCFLCVGLRDKEHCIENVQYSKKEYTARMKDCDFGSHAFYQSCYARRRALEKDHLFKEYHGHNTVDCSGDYLVNCKNTRASFDCEDSEDGAYLYQVVTGAKDNQDIYQYGLNLRESYECSIAGNNCHHILFSHNAHVNCSDLLYCWFLQSSKDCFGCVSMHHKRYCILNTQYSKEEYEALLPRIVAHMVKTGEWGELFPARLSPFGYNKTNAQLYFPLTREQATKKRYHWDDNELTPSAVARTINANDLPDNIRDIPDDILNWAVTCEETNRPFRITPQELRFYREQSLPIPRRSPDQRHIDRFHRRNPRTFWERPCAQCGKTIRTTYAPDRPEKVACEECYLKNIG